MRPAGYLKLVRERFLDVRAFYIDQTGVGEVFIENARKYGLRNVKGNRAVVAAEAGCDDLLETAHGAEATAHTERQGIDRRDERGDCGVDTDREDEVLPPLRDP